MATKSKKVASKGKTKDIQVYRGKDAIRIILDTGLLWYVNKIAFHLCGFRLLLDEARGEIVLEDHRDYPDVVYSPDLYQQGHSRFAKYMAERGSAVLQYRKQILGFDTQPNPSETKTA